MKDQPTRNVEIKARVPNLPALRAKVVRLAGVSSEVLNQTDTFFVVPQGRLKLREFQDSSGELIFYERPDRSGPKESSYIRMSCPEPREIAAILERVFLTPEGTPGIRGIVEKRRELFMIGRTRIHLDEVRGLGSFLEIEVVLDPDEPAEQGVKVARELLSALGVPDSDLIAPAYIDLLEEKQDRPSS